MLKASLMVKKEKRSGLLGALVTPTVKTEILRICEKEERSQSFVAGALIERGLELYKTDHQLRPRQKDGKFLVSANTHQPK